MRRGSTRRIFCGVISNRLDLIYQLKRVQMSVESAQQKDEQIIAMIKEQEAGEKTADVCRRHGISPASFYKFKAKYGGMNVSDTYRLNLLEDENGKLKKLPAEHLFDSLRHARNLVPAWRMDFNQHRPHSSLAGLTPHEYANRSNEDQSLNRANLN